MRRTACLLGAALLMIMTLAAPAAAADPVFYEGHFYEVVAATSSWNDSRAEAAASTYLGSEGHLVTITSAGENSFVNDLVPPGLTYIGIHDQASEGTFEWVTGEIVDYTAWEPGEPNNFDGIEDCTIQFAHGSWNDTGCGWTAANYYVIEYDGPFDSDTDGDGVGDTVDTDDDDDGVEDGEDAFPRDPDESVDTDGDGTGDNADPDDDGDGVDDDEDAFPRDAQEQTDTDGDGTGDNADADDDGDGVDDDEDAFPKDPDRHAHPEEPDSGTADRGTEDGGTSDEEEEGGVADAGAERGQAEAVEDAEVALAATGASLPVLVAIGLNLIAAGIVLLALTPRYRRAMRST